MKDSFQLNLAVATILMASGFAHASIANVSENGLSSQLHNMAVEVSPNVLTVTLTGSPSLFFEKYVNPTLSNISGSANTYLLSLERINLFEIRGLTSGVWRNVFPAGSALSPTFSDNNATKLTGTLANRNYYQDTNDSSGNVVQIGEYAMARHEFPAPEPEAYAMLLVGLGLVGFSLRRRKTAYF
jgi:hypothetical protein